MFSSLTGPHVDSIKFSGDIVAGLSLQSTRIMALTYSPETVATDAIPNDSITMRFAPVDSYTVDTTGIKYSLLENPDRTPDSNKNKTVCLPDRIELVLPPRSLYILDGPWRYYYNHAILGQKCSSKLLPTEQSHIPVQQRTSIIFRDCKNIC
jgi:hypothetical protein